MKRSILTLAAVALAMAMLAPTALAAWGMYGSREPDNKYDANGAYMWTGGPDPTGCADNGGCTIDRVYFNVFESAGPGPEITPNTALLGSRLYFEGGRLFSGWLGQWTDCNHDGYIGLGAGALREYRDVASAAAGSPVDESICPSLNGALASNQGKVHYDANGGWVTEMIYVTPVAPQNDTRQLLDSKAKVWGDGGRPEPVGVEPTGNDNGQCQSVNLVFLATGESHHTGGFLTHSECLLSVVGGTAQSPVGLTPGQMWEFLEGSPAKPIADATGNPRNLYTNGGILDQPTFGDDKACPSGAKQPCDGENQAYVYGETDCSGTKTVVPETDTGVESPVDGKNVLVPAVKVHTPGTPKTNTKGSIAATVNETNEEASAGSVGNTDVGLDDCDSTNDSGGDLYGNFETDTAGGVSANHKSKSVFAFSWNGPTFGRGVMCTVGDPVSCDGSSPQCSQGAPCSPCDPRVSAVLCGAPEDFGFPAAFNSLVIGENMWSTYINQAPVPVTRNQATGDVEVSPADYWSWYAHVEAPGLAFPSGATGGTYGSAFCYEGITRNAPSHWGWECDPANWNLDANGNVLPGRLGTVGDSYQLRDVDCDDNTVVAANSGLVANDLGPRQIARGAGVGTAVSDCY